MKLSDFGLLNVCDSAESPGQSSVDINHRILLSSPYRNYSASISNKVCM